MSTLPHIKAIFNNPGYWNGKGLEGYAGDGYSDFAVHGDKAAYIAGRFPERVLDVGCAYGYLVQRLREMGVDAWGIDVSDYAISQAPASVGPYVQVAYAHHLPFRDNHFQAICCFGMLEHVPGDLLEATLKEFKRVANAGVLSVSFSTSPQSHEDSSHVSLKKYREWLPMLPDRYELWDDDMTVWQRAAIDRVTLVAPTIYPVGGDGYGGIERLVSLFARAFRQLGTLLRCICADGSVLPAGTERVTTGSPIPDYREPGLIPTILSMKGVGRCYLDFSHSKPIGRIDPYENYIALIWHDPCIMEPWEPRYNVAALSEWQAARFREIYKQDCIVLDPICGDGDYFIPGNPGDQREEYLIFMGILSPDKGALVAIEACKKLKQKLKVLGVVTPGCPPGYVETVKRACDGVDIQNIGEVSAAYKRLLLQGAKALLYPVSYPQGQGEAHSHKSVESMLCGTPVILFDQGAMKEVVDEGVTGFVVPGQSELGFAIRECEMLDRGKCREKAMERWDYRATVKRWLPVMEQVGRGAKW